MKRKVTLLVCEETAEALRRAVAEGYARSQSSFVEQAVRAYETAVTRERIREDYREAARDPAFLEDLQAIARDFAEVDAELPLDG